MFKTIAHPKHKSIYLTVLALIKNIENPGYFSNELNRLHKMNGLPALNLNGFVPPSLSTIQSCVDPISPNKHSIKPDSYYKPNNICLVHPCKFSNTSRMLQMFVHLYVPAVPMCSSCLYLYIPAVCANMFQLFLYVSAVCTNMFQLCLYVPAVPICSSCAYMFQLFVPLCSSCTYMFKLCR